jgi:hypothetical protein
MMKKYLYLLRFVNMLFLLLTLNLFVGIVHAQSLDIKLDSLMSSGVIFAPANGQVEKQLAPLTMNNNFIFIFDKEDHLEWALGTRVELQDTVAFGLNPQLRLKKDHKSYSTFIGAGLPVFIQPRIRIGTEVLFGFILPLSAGIGIIAQANATTFLFGSDLPDNTITFSLSGNLGLRFNF